MATDGGFDDSDGAPKKKRKKDGPGVTARNMSEDVRKKMSNAVASQAAGLGGKYAWMHAANVTAPTPKPKPAVSSLNPTGGAAGAAANPPAVATTGAGAASTWARPYVPTKKSSTTPTQSQEEDTRTAVTLRDAMFVIKKERATVGEEVL
jgi:Transcription initiation factor TFIID component TAF4 family